MISFDSTYRGKNVFITGHTGFKGSWLSAWLLKLGANVIGYSKDIPTKPSLFKTLNLEKKIEHHLGDVRNLDNLKKIMFNASPDFIFHLAAQPLVKKSYKNPSETFSTNIMGVNNLLDILRDFRKKCAVVIITSDKCYENIEQEQGYKESDLLGGKDPYSASKGAAEIVFRGYYESFFKSQSQIQIATARAGNVIGGGDWASDRLIPDCIKAWLKKDIVEVRSPNATRPWQHVLEPLSGYLMLAERLYLTNKINGESFNFGPLSDNKNSVMDVLKLLSKKISISELPCNYEIVNANTFHEATLLQLDCEKASSVLNWQATLNFEETMEFTTQWYFKNKMIPNKIEGFTMKQIELYTEIAIGKKVI